LRFGETPETIAPTSRFVATLVVDPVRVIDGDTVAAGFVACAVLEVIVTDTMRGGW
jgi:hypothetical protein